MPKQPQNWPSGSLPRGLDCELAAYYVGLCPTTFLKRVNAGKYPQPMPSDDKRAIWDKKALDAAMDRQSALKDRPKEDGENLTAAEEAAAEAVRQRLANRKR